MSDLHRGTGRTTRMLVNIAMSGHPAALLIATTHRHAQNLSERCHAIQEAIHGRVVTQVTAYNPDDRFMDISCFRFAYVDHSVNGDIV